jgi:Fe-S-cluster containining protein
VEQLDFGNKLNRRLQNAFGDLRRHTRTHCSDISAIKREIRDLMMDVAMLKRALTSLGQVGVMERRKIERELIVELFPPRAVRRGTGVVTASPQGQAATVECESRLPLCKAACCRIFNISLTPQEVEQGLHEWNPRQPYTVQKNRFGCMYLAAGRCSCSIYNLRPVVCSNYSCAKDGRIWADFERKELNPDLEKLLQTLAGCTARPGANGRSGVRGTEASVDTVAVSQPLEAARPGDGNSTASGGAAQMAGCQDQTEDCRVENDEPQQGDAR